MDREAPKSDAGVCLTLGGALLRAERKRLGIPLRELARRGGVSAGLLCRVERGQEKPSSRILGVYADVLGLDIDALSGACGRVPDDVVSYLAANPLAIQRLRGEMGMLRSA